MDATIVVAAIGTVGTLGGLIVGRRQRRAAAREMEAGIYERLVDTLGAEMTRLQDRLQELERRLSTYEAREQEHLHEIAELRRERDALRQRLAAAEATVASQSAEITRVSALTEHAQVQLGAGAPTT